MDRRKFFKQGLDKVGEVLVSAADAKARERAKHWIRPPFALPELDFLTTCTRCGDCIDACPHQTVFPLAARLGASVVGTPALDLIHSACHLCEDWPCIAACKVGALALPRPGQTQPDQHQPADEPQQQPTAPVSYPLLARAAIDTGRCLPYLGPDCGVCRDSCPVDGAMTWSLGRPSINPELCVGCARCRSVCIANPKAVTIHSLSGDGKARNA